MENALVVGSARQVASVPQGVTRVYYGAEFCQRLIPDRAALEAVRKAAHARRLPFTLLTPYVTDRGLRTLLPLIAYLDRAGDGDEIVVNDWGVFWAIQGKFRRINLVLGRLLTKQRRDPAAREVLLDRQAGMKMSGEDGGGTVLVLPKKTPASVKEHYRSSVINLPAFQRYLLAHGVRRIEIDNLLWDMRVSVDPRIGVSIHAPYAYLSTTRLCGLLSLSYAPCRKECSGRDVVARDDASPVPLHICGNTVFFETRLPSRASLRARGIDRVVSRGG